MKFEFGNKIPFCIARGERGKRKIQVIQGIPGDRDWSISEDPELQSQQDDRVLLFGKKPNSPTLFIMVFKQSLNWFQKQELGIHN